MLQEKKEERAGAILLASLKKKNPSAFVCVDFCEPVRLVVGVSECLRL